MKTRIKINGILISCVVISALLFQNVFLRHGKNNSWQLILDVAGLALILWGQLMRVSARGFKAENSKSGHVLIQGGPYGLVRNPMYLGILLIGLGIVLELFQWWALAVFAAVFTLRYITLIFKEEEILRTAFPEEYPVYRKQVPRLFPRMGPLLKQDLSVYLPLKLRWLKKEISSILSVLSGVLLIKSWQMIAHQGIKSFLDEAAILLCVVLLFAGVVSYLSRVSSVKENQ